MPRIIFDASAYRALARDRSVGEARDAARALADAAHARDLQPVASPFTLWSLLADVAAVVAPPGERGGKSGRGPTEAEQARAERARLALAACAVHAAKEPGAAGPHPFVLGEDPETRLCRAVGVQPPPGLAAWNEYLASLAAEVAAEPTPERAQRLVGPLGHVAERARATIEDYADEMQDALLATYETASSAFGWDEGVSDEERQRTLSRPVTLDASLDAVRDAEAEEGTIGEPLMIELLRRDPLLRAVATRRAARAHRLATGVPTESVDAASEPTLGETALVAERFTAGTALARELLRRIIAGDVEMAGRAARRWLWDLHTAFGLEQETGVTGSTVIGDALGPAVRGIETLDRHRAALGA